jgi:hypothetical protein
MSEWINSDKREKIMAKRRKRIQIGETVYESAGEAAKAFGVTPPCIRWKIKHKRDMKGMECKYLIK